MPVGISYRAMLAAAGSSAAADAYIVNSFAPPVVADFAGVLNSGTEYYRVGGSETTFDSMFTFSETTSGLRTMTDSDGNLKWAPHNVITYSEDYLQWAHTGAGTFADATLSNGVGGASKTKTGAATDYCKYFVRDLINAADIVSETSYTTSTTTAQYESVTFTTPSGCTSIRVSGQRDSSVRMSYVDSIVVEANTDYTLAFWHQVDAGNNNHLVGGYHIYKSSLGGMVDNPDNAISGGGKYVPTSGAAVYQARRNHYRYNGTSFVNKGILLESEARTNLITNSFGPADASTAATLTYAVTSSPDGNMDGDLIVPTTANTAHWMYYTGGSTIINLPYVQSYYVKPNGYAWVQLTGSTGFASSYINFHLSGSGSIGNQTGSGEVGTIEEVGGGWYRISYFDLSSSTGGSRRIIFGVLNADTASRLPSFAGDGTSGVYFWAPQFEEAYTPSSCMPTSGATVTRAAETMTLSATNHGMTTSDVSGQIQGAYTGYDDNANQVYWPFYMDSSGQRLRVAIDDQGAYNGRLNIEFRDNSTSAYRTAGGTSGIPTGLNSEFNIGWRLDRGTEANAALNGTAGTAAAYTGTPDYSSATVSFTSTVFIATGTLSGAEIALLRIWSSADIGDTGIASATS